MDKDVIEKCLAFCQALSNSNQLFSFNLKIGSDSFNFDMKELAKSSCFKKKSPRDNWDEISSLSLHKISQAEARLS